MEIFIPDELKGHEPDLKMFLESMVIKLVANSHKGNWADANILTVLELLENERLELLDALNDNDIDAVYWECVDIGNFALIAAMVALRGPNPFRTRAKPGSAMDFIRWAAKQNTNGCILWPFKSRTGPKQEYGGLSKNVHSEGRRAHRVLCSIAHGPPPTPEHHASHLCEDPLCINPNHVVWETSEENHAHKREHGTWVVPNKLSWEIAREIRVKYSLGNTVIDLAKKYDVSVQSVYKIVNNQTYKEDYT